MPHLKFIYFSQIQPSSVKVKVGETIHLAVA